jgi:hypothetical protein
MSRFSVDLGGVGTEPERPARGQSLLDLAVQTRATSHYTWSIRNYTPHHKRQITVWAAIIPAPINLITADWFRITTNNFDVLITSWGYPETSTG